MMVTLPLKIPRWGFNLSFLSSRLKIKFLEKMPRSRLFFLLIADQQILSPIVFYSSQNQHSWKVQISAIEVVFSGYPKCLDLIFIYLPGLIISSGDHRLLFLRLQWHLARRQQLSLWLNIRYSPVQIRLPPPMKMKVGYLAWPIF